ncbi:hypothetical protein CupriaWKF_09495 [Cupriavidus sp. WKF15]|uniref:hypothetical protein n=1 Tax=Cupriavidus sp. WKF15 TaxID=3032282 RepID=UPI0023E1DACF|nr:hypothetical protein [Cupriavidus sp. WKF15]WER44586.1 hypothetical protein CupriaWKF_09495 [Cupriavidus sp. WKF15]
MGLLTGVALACLCAWAAKSARRHAEAGATESMPAAPEQAVDPKPLPEAATDIVEYRGFMVHVFCHALSIDRFKAVCDIWEAGAVVLEGGGPPATYPTPDEARVAAIAWARQWVQRNG